MKLSEITIDQLKLHAPELVESIKNEVDPEEETQKLRDRIEELENSEKSLQKELEKVSTELDTLKLKVDEYQAKEAVDKKRELRDKKLAEADLPEDYITPLFKESLMKMDEETMDKHIAERKEIAEKKKGGVTDMGDETDLKDDKDDKKKAGDLEESDKDKIKSAFGVKK
jgi:hypothetical protein